VKEGEGQSALLFEEGKGFSVFFIQWVVEIELGFRAYKQAKSPKLHDFTI
jgi:hypothetical protein